MSSADSAHGHGHIVYNTDTYHNVPPKVDTDTPAPCHFRPACFIDLVSNELVLITLTSYLRAPSLLSLSSVSKAIQHAMRTTPGVWKTIDLTDFQLSSDAENALVTFLRQPFVRRDCRQLFLDGVDLMPKLLEQIVQFETPNLRSLSLRSCPQLDGDSLAALIGYVRRPSAPRPLSLRYIALLGEPLFPLNAPSYHAPNIVATAGNEIYTDLHSLQCWGKDHIGNDILERKWHLKTALNHQCVLCMAPQEVCIKCHLKKSCGGCHSFFCDDCEPYPNVLPLKCGLIAELSCHVLSMRKAM
jgi:hypothetical protein